MEVKVLYELALPPEEEIRELSVFRPAGGRQTGEKPGKLFEKELIRSGTWVHPSRKFRLTVTSERMRKWIARFRQMQANGLKVPVPYGHSYSPRDNVGFLEGLKMVGNCLVGLIRVPEQADVEKIGSTIKDVSLSIDPDFRDGTGRRYGEVIEHVALTNYPVVPAQEDFVAVPMGNEKRAYIWQFACEELAPRQEPDTAGGDAPAGCDAPVGEQPTLHLDLVDIRERFELEGKVTQSNWLEKLQAKFASLKRNLSAMSASAAKGEKVRERDEEKTEKSAEVLALQKELESLRHQQVDAEVTGLVHTGRISPAMAAPARRLLSLPTRQVIHLEVLDEDVEVRQEFAKFLSALPEGSVVPLVGSSLVEVEPPSEGISDERARRLSEENRRLAKLAEGGDNSSTASPPAK